MPEISVLLNNYNYGRFLGEAIASVLAQEYQDFELIIVDDGSTDNSEEIIDSFSDERIRKIRKANGGQLSAFNRGFAESRGKILCFLDSDDVYPPGYLQTVAAFYAENPGCGCLLGQVEYFGSRTGSGEPRHHPGALAGNPFAVIADYRWMGTPTSAYSIRRSYAEKFLPYPNGEKYWRVRADDLLVWGAELAGAAKYAFTSPRVKYRVHGGNAFFGTEAEKKEAERRKRLLAADAFFAWVMRKNHLTPMILLRRENRTGDLPFKERFRNWYKIGREHRIGLWTWFLCWVNLMMKIKE